MTEIKLTEEEKQNAYMTVYDFINDQDDTYPREHIDKYLAMFHYMVYR